MTTTPEPQTLPAFAERESEVFAPVYRMPRLDLAEGRGARVRDTAGRWYLDFTSGVAVNAFGHAPAGLAEAVAAQLGTLGHCSNLFAHAPGEALARALTAATGYPKTFFCNSGAEGIEAALKFARARARRLGKAGRDIVAFSGGFHGRTGFALSATENPHYREPFAPLVPGVRFAPYNDVTALDAVLDADVCAVVVEPVQGEAGAIPASRDFLLALRARTSALDAALIVDEIQTGMGRTGRLLASEHAGVRGDLVVMSKALGAGLPIGAVLMTDDVAAGLAPGMHGCTFGGNPACAAAALWSLEHLLAPGFLGTVRKRARQLDGHLDALTARHAAIAGHRGLGLLRALVVANASPLSPDDIVAAARARGLLLVRGGDDAVRVLPPLNVTAEELAEAFAMLDAALVDISGRGGGTT